MVIDEWKLFSSNFVCVNKSSRASKNEQCILLVVVLLQYGNRQCIRERVLYSKIANGVRIEAVRFNLVNYMSNDATAVYLHIFIMYIKCYSSAQLKKLHFADFETTPNELFWYNWSCAQREI